MTSKQVPVATTVFEAVSAIVVAMNRAFDPSLNGPSQPIFDRNRTRGMKLIQNTKLANKMIRIIIQLSISAQQNPQRYIKGIKKDKPPLGLMLGPSIIGATPSPSQGQLFRICYHHRLSRRDRRLPTQRQPNTSYKRISLKAQNQINEYGNVRWQVENSRRTIIWRCCIISRRRCQTRRNFDWDICLDCVANPRKAHSTSQIIL